MIVDRTTDDAGWILPINVLTTSCCVLFSEWQVVEETSFGQPQFSFLAIIVLIFFVFDIKKLAAFDEKDKVFCTWQYQLLYDCWSGNAKMLVDLAYSVCVQPRNFLTAGWDRKNFLLCGYLPV